jgi:short-subunit dehydrogenase
VGASLARQLGDRGVNVVLVARRQTALDEVAADVSTDTRTVVLDLSIPNAHDELAAATADLDVGLFVYNAGADPYISTFLDQPLAAWNDMLTRNCVTVLGATHHFAGRMTERGRGGIVLVTSGAAWAGGSHIAVYGATKAFDLILAEALWAELRPQGVDVLAVVLGTTDTPAFRRAFGDRDVPGIADPEDVARDLLDNLANGPTFPPDASPVGGIDRRTAVELISQAGAALRA